MPELGLAGLMVKFAILPECKPTPLNTIFFLIVFCFKNDTEAFTTVLELSKFKKYYQ